MSTALPSTRRLAIAMTAAVATITIAIGTTAASLLGWLHPAAPPAAAAPLVPAAGTSPSPVIFVPITPAAPSTVVPAPPPDEGQASPGLQLVMHEREHGRPERAGSHHQADHGEDDDD